MTTLSIPLTPELAQFVEKTIKETGQTRAEVVRQALKLYAEEQAVRKVLLAQAEPTLTGELDVLAAQID
jgi:metal-responsive CopG/Arc/MetJ family transcriptional regulator